MEISLKLCFGITLGCFDLFRISSLPLSMLSHMVFSLCRIFCLTSYAASPSQDRHLPSAPQRLWYLSPGLSLFFMFAIAIWISHSVIIAWFLASGGGVGMAGIDSGSCGNSVLRCASRYSMQHMRASLLFLVCVPFSLYLNWMVSILSHVKRDYMVIVISEVHLLFISFVLCAISHIYIMKHKL